MQIHDIYIYTYMFNYFYLDKIIIIIYESIDSMNNTYLQINSYDYVQLYCSYIYYKVDI